jgi:hypothetical protein
MYLSDWLYPIRSWSLSVNMPSENQEDGVSCCTFALASATALAFKLNPSELRNNKKTIRQHLIKSYWTRKRKPFLLLERARIWSDGLKKQLSIDLNCICKRPFYEKDCGMPENYRKVVQSISCKIWWYMTDLNANKFLVIMFTTRERCYFALNVELASACVILTRF